MSVTEVHNFIRAEVERQGFDLTKIEGHQRVVWMGMAWDYARAASGLRRPTVDDAMALGRLVEPTRNKSGFRQTPLFVEGERVVDWRDVSGAMEKMWEHGQTLRPLAFYTEFELIHPFRDGNGRVGAIIYNWQNGTLDAPEVPADVFEEGWGPEARREAVNYPIQGAGEVGHVVEPDIGKHDCDEPECRKCHNCGITGVDIDSKWNLCDGCSDAPGMWDEEAEEHEAELDAVEELEECCSPWWEPCCTEDGRPL